MSFESVEDNFPLLHLLELVSKEYLLSDVTLTPSTDQHDSGVIACHLHADDAAVLRTLNPEDIQSWCLSRIVDYRFYISTFRTRPDSIMYNATLHESVAQLKSNMCALRSAYNDAAPIHRLLPPEILLEIFANFRHDGTQRGHAALWVCHYWHALLQRTPQFWKSLLGQEFQGKQEPQWKIARFGTACSKSVPLDVSLRLRGLDAATVDVLIPHSHRIISSMTIRIKGLSPEREVLDRFLQLDMPLRELEIRTRIARFHRSTTRAYIIRFSMFQHLHTLRLSSFYCEPPKAPHAALKNLELNCCWGPSESDFPCSPDTNLALRTIIATIRNCPNLETLCVTGWPPNTLSSLDTSVKVSVPRLRHVTLQISSESMLALLSCLLLPLTTFLDLEPRFSYMDHQTPLPLFTSLVSPLPDHPPAAEVVMRLEFLFNVYRFKNVATWEARGAKSRPLRVSTFLFVSHDPFDHDKTLEYTEQVLAIYAPGTVVTSLTITGARRAPEKHFWTSLLAGLPHLTRLVVDGGDVRRSPLLFALLAKVQRGGGCLCPRLADLSVFWSERRRTPDTATVFTAIDPDYLSLPPTADVDEALFRQPYGPAETHAYCRVLELCLRNRVEHGCCPLKALSVSIWDFWMGRGDRDTGHGAASAVEAVLREGLGDLVDDVFVVLQSEWKV